MSLYDALLARMDAEWRGNTEYDKARQLDEAQAVEFLVERIHESPAIAIMTLCELLDDRAAAARNLADQQAIMRQVTSRA